MIRCKTVGKIFLLMVSCISFLQAAMHVRMAIVDDEGNIPIQLATGQVYTLEVKIDGASSAAQQPQIAGLDDIEFRATGVNMNIINGQASMKYTYRMRIDKPGTYKIGPAEVRDGNDKGHSNKILLKVGASQINDSNKSTKKVPQENRRAFLKTTVDKHLAVVGEKIKCTTRFYQFGDSATLQSVRVPDFAGFAASQQKGPFAGTHVIDGITYSYVEWRWDLYAQQTGQVTIPAFSADFALRPDEDFFGGIAALFRSMHDKKRIYSNPVKIDIEALPPHKPPVKAVGDFRSFTVIVDNPVIKEGEGCVLTFELEGDGNLEALENLDITGIPEALKWFSSKSYLVPEASGATPTKKRFEFVLQGIQAGSWEIPVQKFTYYDVLSKKYKTLSTQAVALSVTGNRHKKQLAQNTTSTPEVTSQETGHKKNDAELMPLYPHYDMVGARERAMPWWLFIGAALLPFSILFIQQCRRWWKHMSALRYFKTRERRAFSDARMQLKKISSMQDYTQLHGLLMQLFAQRCKIPISEVSQERIEQILRDHHFEQSEIDDWNEYYTQLSAIAFAHNATDVNVENLVNKAYIWIARLEERL